MRSRQAVAAFASLALIVALGACGSDSKDKTSGSTSTSGKPSGPPSIDSFKVPSEADCSTSPGRVDVEWKTTNATEVALFVDGNQEASGPYADGNDTLQVACDGDQHQVRLDATDGSEKASRSASVTTKSGGGQPTQCADSQGIGQAAVGAYGAHIGNTDPQVTVFSIRCAPATGSIPGEYALVTLTTHVSSGRFRVLMVQPPATADQGATSIGYDTEEGQPPLFTYTDCSLDPAALAALGLPTLQPDGGTGTKNCPITG